MPSFSAPRNAAFIVYINGLEVPAKSVYMRYGVWQIPEMQIEMVADPILVRLGAEDRVQVAVFYLDDTKVDPSAEPQFRLLCEGEITGWGYRNLPGSRSIVFTVSNQIAIMNKLFVQFMTSVDNMQGSLTGPAEVTTILQATDKIVYPYCLFVQGVVSQPGSETIVRPFDFAYNIVKGIISSIIPADRRSVPAANFFSRWARLTNFHNRFTALPVFDDPAKYGNNKNVFPVVAALQRTVAIDTIAQNLLPNAQSAGSFWDMLQLVYTTMLMEVSMLPCMPLAEVDLATGLIRPTDFNTHKLHLITVSNGKYLDASTGQDLSFLQKTKTAASVDGRWVSGITPDVRRKYPRRLVNYFTKPQFFFGLPPSCNVIFPSQIKSLVYDENYSEQPTRIYFNEEVLSKVAKLPQSGNTDMINNILSRGYPYEADLGAKQQSGSGVNSKNFLIFPEEYFKGPVMERREIPPWLFFLEQTAAATKPADTPTADNSPPVTNTQPTVYTAPTTTPQPPLPTGTVMDTAPNGRVGKVGPDGKRRFDRAVERLRPLAEGAQARTGQPADFLLAWIQAESGGVLITVTDLNERGYFQIMGPHLRKGEPVPLKDTEASKIGLDEESHRLLTTNAQFSFDKGVDLVLYCRKRVSSAIKMYGLGGWSTGDVCRLTKLYHALPAHVYGGSGRRSFPKAAVDALGRPPVSWEEMWQVIFPTATESEKKFLRLATAIGGVVAGASGVMATVEDRTPVKAPTVVAPPSTAEAATTVTAATTSRPSFTPPDLEALRQKSEDVYALYCKFEYYRERYSKRTGSVQMAWNPYVVPGFPAAVFDNRASRVDLLCYVTTVQHTLSHDGQRSTSVSFLYGRQFQEMFDILKQDLDSGIASVAVSPAEPIRSVSDVIQSFEQAELFYRDLFFAGSPRYNKDAAFDYRKLVGYIPSTSTDTPDPIYVDLPSVSLQTSLANKGNEVNALTASKNVLEQTILQIKKAISQYDVDIKLTQRRIDGLPEDLVSVIKLGISDVKATINSSYQEELASALENTGANPELIANAPPQAVNDATWSALNPSIALKDPRNLQAIAAAASNTDNRRDLITQTLTTVLAVQETIKEGLETKLTAAEAGLSSVNASLTALIAEGAEIQKQITVTKPQHNLDGTRDLMPTAAGRPMFDSYDKAMAYNWRPICTLDEYVVFYDSAGEGSIPAFGHANSVGARYFERIRQLIPIPSDYAPPPEIKDAATIISGAINQVPGLAYSTFPQIREDWDKTLQAYRQNVLSVKIPRT